jgi:transcriptional regulator with XRE-family HTH domain
MGDIGPSAFGLLLRQQRGDAGLTQEELADRARLSARVISDLERGVSQNPHLSTVHHLAEALDLSGEERARFERTARGGPFPFPAAAESHGPAAPAIVPPPTNLPDEPTPFIGREGEIAALAELLGQPDCRLVSAAASDATGSHRLELQPPF